MSDLSKNRDVHVDGEDVSEQPSYASKEGYYKKLGAYLLLLYKGYLEQETFLEPDIKMALLRMAHFNEDFALKIRMLQMVQFNWDSPLLDGAWDESKEVLFPIADLETPDAVGEAQKNTYKNYKMVVNGLLRSTL